MNWDDLAEGVPDQASSTSIIMVVVEVACCWAGEPASGTTAGLPLFGEW